MPAPWQDADWVKSNRINTLKIQIERVMEHGSEEEKNHLVLALLQTLTAFEEQIAALEDIVNGRA